MTGFQRRVEALVRGEEGDPFAFLGMHRAADGLTVRAFRPRAETLELVDERSGDAVAHFERLHPEGVFALQLPPGEPFAYRLRERSVHGVRDFDDPYRFAPLLGEIDVWLLAQGSPLAALRGARRPRAHARRRGAARRLRSGLPTRAGLASSATSTVGTAAACDALSPRVRRVGIFIPGELAGLALQIRDRRSSAADCFRCAADPLARIRTAPGATPRSSGSPKLVRMVRRGRA